MHLLSEICYMGWSRVAKLNVKEESESVEECGLFSRGGLEGVVVLIENKWIEIPKSVLIELVAEELVSQEISRLEQLEGQAAIDYLISR